MLLPLACLLFSTSPFPANTSPLGQEPEVEPEVVAATDASSTEKRADIDDRAVQKAIDTAIALLLNNQERYKSDRPVGRLDNDKLAEWQENELERLEKIRNRGRKGKRPNTEWPYEGVYRAGALGAIPSGYRVGGTAITCDALLRAPGYEKDKERQKAVQLGVEFILERLATDEQLESSRQGNYDVRGWAQAYSLYLLLEVSHHNWVDKKTVKACKEMIPHLIDCLEAGEVKGGGWNYAGGACSPFMTGPTLLFLFLAEERGYEVPSDLVTSALDALEAGKNPKTGSYGYAGKRREPMPASSGRAAVAELALFKAGRSDAEQLNRAVLGFFDNWDHLFDRKSKQGTHVGKYSIAPYYFFFAHTYAALAIESLPLEQRPDLRQRMRQLLWDTQQENGGWNDRIFPRTESYSTAMSILALVAPQLPEPSVWIPEKGAEEAEPKPKTDAEEAR